MKIILREKVERLGEKGQVIEVADGFARNFLLPKGLALPETASNIKRAKEERQTQANQETKLKEKSLRLAERLSNLSCTISMKVSQDDKLFGSVTPASIADALKNEGIEIDKKSILIEEPIKKLGVYRIPIRLHPEVDATLKVWVERSDGS